MKKPGTDGFLVFLCGNKLMCHVQQIAPENHLQVFAPGKILGKTQGAVFSQMQSTAVCQNICHELRAEIMIFPAQRNPKKHSCHHTQSAVAQLFLIFLKRLNELPGGGVGVAADFQGIQYTGERFASRFVIPGNTFHNKSFADKAVKCVQILFQSNGGMGIGKTGP